MTDRAVTPHQRTTLAASTPAARLSELQQQIHHLERERDEARIRAEKAEEKALRYTRFGEATLGGIICAQYLCDFLLWERLLNTYPVNAIVEIGTYQGGFSLYLDAQARARGIEFVTFDVIVPEREIPGFIKCDVFADPEKVLAWVETEDVALLCDGGNKPRELHTFTEALTPGSFVVAHDWMAETFPEDIPDWLEEIHGDVCDDLGSVSRVFKRRV